MKKNEKSVCRDVITGNGTGNGDDSIGSRNKASTGRFQKGDD